jgi:hypothetical protein
LADAELQPARTDPSSDLASAKADPTNACHDDTGSGARQPVASHGSREDSITPGPRSFGCASG